MSRSIKIIDNISGVLDEGRGAYLSGLKGSAISYMIGLLYKRLGRPVLLAVPDDRDALELEAELKAFVGEKVRIFPPRKAGNKNGSAASRAAALAMLASAEMETDQSSPTPLPVIIAPVRALMEVCEPHGKLLEYCEVLSIGLERDLDLLAEKLVKGGYERRPAAQDPGEFSVRGGILDIVPPSGEAPVRLEFLADTIESIRYYDPQTQLSKGHSDHFYLVPAVELETDESQQATTLFDVLDNNACALIVDPLRVETEAALIEQSGEESNRVLGSQDVLDLLTSIPYAKLGGLMLSKPPSEKMFELTSDTNDDIRQQVFSPKLKDGDADEDEGPLLGLARRIREFRQKGSSVVLTSRTASQAARMEKIFAEYNVGLSASVPEGNCLLDGLLDSTPDKVELYISTLKHGFRFQEAKIVVITEEDIFGEKVKRPTSSPRGLSDPQAIAPGDYVVHVDHGIAIYKGIEKLVAMGSTGEYLRLEYADKAKLYTPIHRMGLVEKYYGVGEMEPDIDSLGAVKWTKAKEKAELAAMEYAKELVDLYALREIKKGHAFGEVDRVFREFESTFPFEETPDQAKSIRDVLDDMCEDKPMDRLVCGDVGYGKTEVALRAAFKSAMEGKQVAVLVPTTVLAQQHHTTFRTRLEPYPIRVEMLSRFQTRQEQKIIVQDIADGMVDIVIGTHRLLQKDIVFKDLGLLIVDEEHRFGVTHKEKIKKFKKNVDVLSMSATPIPRTLKMGLLGLRDISIIDSAPADRLAITTRVAGFEEGLIREAIQAELDRGGQVFFVHNRVKGIENMELMIKRLVPEARVIHAHGQMPENKLEKVMSDFISGKYDVLVCTAIIESGLDIPRANTIIIDQAHMLGMAELYQLRGRVGRSTFKGYAYLLIPTEYHLSKDAHERIKALTEFSELGSGIKIAQHDLRIRGAGEILGSKQSGQVGRVGYELYMKMIKSAVARLKGQGADIEEIEPEINIGVDAYISDSYVQEPTQRMLHYRRLTRASTDDELDMLRIELEDRYGELPTEVDALIRMLSLRLVLKQASAKSASLSGKICKLSFHENTSISREKLMKLVSQYPHKYKITPNNELHMVIDGENPMDGVVEIVALLKQLMNNDSLSHSKQTSRSAVL